jgi:hypothetical protein
MATDSPIPDGNMSIKLHIVRDEPLSELDADLGSVARRLLQPPQVLMYTDIPSTWVFLETGELKPGHFDFTR